MGEVSRARGLERSAVNELSSLISDQRETSHPEGEQGNYLNCTTDLPLHQDQSQLWVQALLFGKGRIKSVFPDLQNNLFPSNTQSSSKPVGSTGKQSLKTLSQYIKIDHMELKLNKLSLELRCFVFLISQHNY